MVYAWCDPDIHYILLTGQYSIAAQPGRQARLHCSNVTTSLRSLR